MVFFTTFYQLFFYAIFLNHYKLMSKNGWEFVGAGYWSFYAAIDSPLQLRGYVFRAINSPASIIKNEANNKNFDIPASRNKLFINRITQTFRNIYLGEQLFGNFSQNNSLSSTKGACQYLVMGWVLNSFNLMMIQKNSC